MGRITSGGSSFTPVGAALMLLTAHATAGARVCAAQDARESVPSRGPTIGVWSAVARDEPLKTRVGHTHDRDLYALGVRAVWALAGRGAVRLDYEANVLPAVVSTQMPEYDCATAAAGCPPWASGVRLAGDRSVYGFGALPVGLRLRVAAGPRLALVARGNAGVVLFRQRVPDPGETRLNFWGDLGTGAELGVGRGLTAEAGFRLNHVSNANTGPVNPGMNSRMLELGVSWRR